MTYEEKKAWLWRYRTACGNGLLRRVGRKMGVELGAGLFQFRAVVEHRVRLPALHVGVQLLCVVGSGGRLHGNKELCVHGVHLVFSFFRVLAPT